MNKTRAKMLENIGELSHEDAMEIITEDLGLTDALTRSVQAEADVLNAFLDMIRKIKSLEWMLKPSMSRPMMSPYGGEQSAKEVLSSKVIAAATRQKLKKIIDEKMPILHKVIEDIFGADEEKHEHEEEHEHEESHDEDE